MSALFATSPKRTPRHGAAVLLTALVCIGAHASSFAHLITVRHVTCPSHAEEMVHAPGQANAPPPSGATRDAWHDASSVAAAEDHCLAVGLDRRATALSGPDAEPGPVPRRRASFAWRGPLAGPAVALFRLAPKNSPPLFGLHRA